MMSEDENNQYKNEIAKLVTLFTEDGPKKTIKAGLIFLEKHPQSYQVQNIMGISYANIGEFEKAEIYYKEALKSNPNSSIAYSNYAKLLFTIGKLDEAIKFLKKAIEYNPKHYKAINNLGVILLMKGRYLESKEILNKAIELEPRNHLAHFNIGNAYKDLELHQAAIQHYKLAIKYGDNKSSVRNNLGITLEKIGKIEEALENYKLILKDDPENAKAYINAASVYRQLGQVSKAKEFNSKAHIFNTDKDIEKYIFMNQGALELDSGDFESSIKFNNKALELDPNLFSAYDNACLTSQKIGDYKSLNSSYRKLYTQLEPSKKIISKNEALNKNLDKMSNIVGLVKNSGRTGSIFLHSLIDGHPEVTSYPGVYFKGYFHPDVWGKLYKGNEDKDWRILLMKNFFMFYAAIFDSTLALDVPGSPFNNSPGYSAGLTTLGKDKNISHKIDKNKFGQYMLTYLETYDRMERSTFFKLIHLAYNSTIGKTNQPSLLFFHIHNPSFVESAQFIKDFPSAKFLQIIRDPIQALESWCTIGNRGINVTNKEKDMENKLATLHNLYLNKFAFVLNYFNNPIIRYGKETAVIKLEDLKLETEVTLRKLSNWLGIKYDESMKNSSFEGHDYWGISDTTPNIKGFSKDSINRKVGIFFSEKDKKRILPLMYYFRKNYSYTNSSNKDFNKELNEASNQVDELFDFEKTLFSKARDNDERGDTQRKGLRLLMKSNFENMHNEIVQLPPIIE